MRLQATALRALAPWWTAGLVPLVLVELLARPLAAAPEGPPDPHLVRGLLRAALALQALLVAAGVLRTATRGTVEHLAAHAVSVRAVARAYVGGGALALVLAALLAALALPRPALGEGPAALVTAVALPLAVLAASLALEAALRGARPPAEVPRHARWSWTLPGAAVAVAAVVLGLSGSREAADGALGIGALAAVAALVLFRLHARRVRRDGSGAFRE